jgi:hypothetical protein
LTKLIRGSIAVALSLAYFLHVFRFPGSNAGHAGLGDWIDPYFINYLLEHWRHSLLAFSDPTSPSMYFPERGTLGYSHSLILYVPFYLPARLFFHPFQAENVSLFLVLVLGSLSLFLLFRKHFRLGFVEALLLTAFFCTSRNVINHGDTAWAQRLSVFLIPPILLVAFAAAEKNRPRGVRLVLAVSAGLLGVLLFTQDFYTAQMALLVGAMAGVGVLIAARQSLMRAVPEFLKIATRGVSLWWPLIACMALAWAVIIHFYPARTHLGPVVISAKDPVRPLVVAALAAGWFLFLRTRRLRSVAPVASPLLQAAAAVWRHERPFMIAFALGALTGGVVFVWIHLGAYLQHPSFPPGHLTNTLVSVNPAAKLSASGWPAAVGAYDSLRSFMLVGLVAILACVPSFRVDSKSRTFAWWLVAVSFVVIILALKFGDMSPWQATIGRLPGFSVIRAPRRIIPLYELAIALLAGLFLARLPERSILRRGIPLLVGLLLVMNWNPERFDFQRPNETFGRWVEAPIAIDPACRSFFMKPASAAYMSRSGHMWSLYGVDAMFVSLDRGIPTLNGYSAWGPPAWELANPQDPVYFQFVDRWIEQHGLRDVCEFDIEQRTMTPYKP